MSETTQDLPAGWRWASPANLAADEPHALAIGPFGSNLKVSDYRDDGVPLVFVRDIRSGEYGRDGTRYVSTEKALGLHAHRVDPGDVLITKMGAPPGDADIYPSWRPPAVITADCIKWRVGSEAVGPFIRHMTNAPQMAAQIQKITSGVAQQKVSLKRFKSLRYPLPPLDEQRRIVDAIEALFSDLDAGEAALRDAKARLVRYRQSVLNAAVTGDLTAEWRATHPDAEPAEALLARISAERREAWEADTLAKYEAKGTPPPKNWKARYTGASALERNDMPDLPESWGWASVGELGAVGTGATPNRGEKKYWENGSIPWVTSGALNDQFVTEASDFVQRRPSQKRTCRFTRLALCSSPCTGRGRQEGKSPN